MSPIRISKSSIACLVRMPQPCRATAIRRWSIGCSIRIIARIAVRCAAAIRATCSGQVRNYCNYHDYPIELRGDYLDRVVPSYFTVVKGMADENALQSHPSDPHKVDRPAPAYEARPAAPRNAGVGEKEGRPCVTECMPGETPSSEVAVESESPRDGGNEVRQHMTECMPGEAPLCEVAMESEGPREVGKEIRQRVTEGIPCEAPKSGIAIDSDRHVTEPMPVLS